MVMLLVVPQLLPYSALKGKDFLFVELLRKATFFFSFLQLHMSCHAQSQLNSGVKIKVGKLKRKFYWLPVLDRRPKFYGRSRRFQTYGYGYGGRSLRPNLRPKVLFVVFLVFSKMEAEMQAFLCFNYTGVTCPQIRLIWIIPQD